MLCMCVCVIFVHLACCVRSSSKFPCAHTELAPVRFQYKRLRNVLRMRTLHVQNRLSPSFDLQAWHGIRMTCVRVHVRYLISQDCFQYSFLQISVCKNNFAVRSKPCSVKRTLRGADDGKTWKNSIDLKRFVLISVAQTKPGFLNFSRITQ